MADTSGMGAPHWFAQAVGSLQHLVGLGRLIKCSGFECATRDQKVDHKVDVPDKRCLRWDCRKSLHTSVDSLRLIAVTNIRTTWKCGRPDGSAMCTSLFSEGVWSLSIPWA